MGWTEQTGTDSEELDAVLHSIVQEHSPPPTPPSPLLLEQTTKTGSRGGRQRGGIFCPQSEAKNKKNAPLYHSLTISHLTIYHLK